MTINSITNNSESKQATETCRICLEDVEATSKVATQLLCSHNKNFHFDCIKEWNERQMNCPLCKKCNGNQIQEKEIQINNAPTRFIVALTLSSAGIAGALGCYCNGLSNGLILGSSIGVLEFAFISVIQCAMRL